MQRAPGPSRGRAYALTFALLASSAGAQDITLTFPLDCTLGTTCFAQSLFDHDPSDGSGDFRCGTLTRDTHGGIDFALPDLAAMRAGVAVRAAAAGVVAGTRDRHPDISADDPASNYGAELCGNGVAIDHGGGWVTQYCHLKRGSLTVGSGDRVAPGAILGEVGLSGATTFPHLHLSVFRNGEKVDPFAPTGQSCDTQGPSLWSPPLDIPAGGILKAGFATAAPSFEAMKDTLKSADILSATSPIVAWVSGYGSQPGDTLHTRITHQSGALFHNHTETLEQRQEAWQRFTGRRFTTTPWPAGAYTAQITLTRGQTTLAETTLTAAIPN
ncbi:MAG: M23 family metallopeptidase [Pseudomonadota bacterium]